MNTQANRDFRRKARFDLWAHQNQPFWSRFQLLYVVQASFFVMVSTVKSDRLLVFVAVAVTLFFTGCLYAILDQDRRLRNFHARKLKADSGFDPLPAEIAARRWIRAELLERLFQLSVFVPFAVLDLYAAYSAGLS